MAHTYNATFVHCIFSTKNRMALIPPALQGRLWAYIFGTAKKLAINLLAVGGTANHIHLLLGLPVTMNVAEAMQKLKANSSRWISEQGIRFQWQDGYGAFSVSPSLVPTVQTYIRNQEQHHQKRDFEDEFRVFLYKSGVVFDSQNVAKGESRP